MNDKGCPENHLCDGCVHLDEQPPTQFCWYCSHKWPCNYKAKKPVEASP